MILADTSVWIDHLRIGSQQMSNRLNQGRIVIHPLITAELALGSLRQRARTLSFLDRLPQLRVAHMNEVRAMIEARRLYSLGIGLVDAHLIASIFINPPTLLWTKDRQLYKVANGLGVHIDLP